MTKVRQLRADAQRNRARVLQAAHEVLASAGFGVPIDEIARRAGLGVGTLYRHFPSKEALLEAIVHSRLARLLDNVQELERAEDPGAAFFDFLSRLLDESAARKDLMDAIIGTSFDWKRAAGQLDIREITARLLARAQRAGAVRGDLSSDEALALVSVMSAAIENLRGQVGARSRIVAVVCDGLRPRG